jgi:hypothetical protein
MMPPGTSLFDFLKIQMCHTLLGYLKIVIGRMVPNGAALDVSQREISVATLL